MKRLFIFIFAILLYCGCKESPIDQHQISDLEQKFSSLTASAKQVFSGSEISVEELKKLRQLEYAVFNISSNQTNEQIANFLSNKGLERWDCFHVEKQKTADEAIDLIFFCKRPVETPLRYLPSTVIGR